MKDWANDGDSGERYRETTFVAKPGETVRATGPDRTRATGSTDEDVDERTEQLREEIEETRVELSHTVDAIQERLKPSTLVDQAKEQAREAVMGATVGRAEHMMSGAGHKARGFQMSIMDTVRSNPVPAAAAALSLGWLWMNRSRGAETEERYMYRERPGRDYGYGQSTYGREYYGASAGYYGQGGYVYGTRPTYGQEQEQSRVGQVADKVGETASQARERVGDMAGDVASGAGRMAGRAGETATDVGETVLETISRNPIPAALTGIGLAWLWMSRRSEDRPYYAHSGGHYWHGNAEYPARYDYEERGMVGRVQERAGQVAGGVTDKASEVAGGVASKAGDVADTAGEVAGQVADTAGRMAGRVADTAGDLTGGVQYRARRTRGSLQNMLDENPLMVGAMAIAAGLAVGMAAPGTEREDEWFGEAREGLMERAKETVQETTEKVQQVAREATSAAKEAAQESAEEQKLPVGSSSAPRTSPQTGTMPTV
jgi:hypothetical protein